MKTTRPQEFLAVALVGLASLTAAQSRAADPLASWNDTATKKAIFTFVEKVTTEGSPDFVPPAERIATFDNDGTLWSEQPMYFQLLFALDRIKALAPQHAEWKSKEPFASLLEGNVKGALAGGEKAIAEIVMATHAGMTTEEFETIVADWISTARHPTTGRLYTDMVYQPMLEMLAYLRAHGFKTFIVSGGGIEFMRPWTGRVYGIPPEQVVGSSIKTKYEVRDGKPVLVRLPELDFIDDKAGKPDAVEAAGTLRSVQALLVLRERDDVVIRLRRLQLAQGRHGNATNVGRFVLERLLQRGNGALVLEDTEGDHDVVPVPLGGRREIIDHDRHAALVTEVG
jgi:hypothetical protein